MRPLIRILVVVALAGSLSGCMLFTTRKEGDDLKKQVKALQTQVETMKARQAQLGKLTTELKELKELLPKVRAVLLRSSARFGVKLARVATDVDKLKGQMENLKAETGGGARSQGALKARMATLTQSVERLRGELTRLVAEVRKREADPQTAAQWWARATRRRVLGNVAGARADYAQLIRKHSGDPRVPAAYYQIARTWYDAYDFRRAVVAVARLLKARPNSKFDARARLLSARSYFELKRCRTAMRILIRAVRRHPHAEVTPASKRLLARLNKIQRVSRFCRR